MAARSLSTTLALAFAGTTLVVFALVGSVLYFALDSQVKQQDDLDIVLAARHTRRLAQELGIARRSARPCGPADEPGAGQSRDVDGSARPGPQPGVRAQHGGHCRSGGAVACIGEPPRRVARITESDIVEWHNAHGAPIRGLASDAVLHDGTPVALVVARNMTDRWRLLDRYRERLYGAGFAGMLLAFLMSWMMVRESLRPLRDIAASARSSRSTPRYAHPGR